MSGQESIPNQADLLKWIKTSILTRSHQYNRGYQGDTYLYEDKRCRLIIKTPKGWGLMRMFRRWMLLREYRVYRRLSGIKGIPACYGFIDSQFLVLEYIDGVPFRQAIISNHGRFYSTFLQVIQSMHEAGVAHSDLKKKDNLLVVDGHLPHIIDFGAAVIKKSGFSPLNGLLYHHARRFDLNAWVKLKYNRKTDHISREDADYYNRTLVETIAHWIKKKYIRIKRFVCKSKT